jgi:HSP20 family protein
MALTRHRSLSDGLSRDVGEIRTQMNRLLNQFFGYSPTFGMPDETWVPAADMFETRDEVVVAVELPGLSEKDINLSITGDTLIIRGERREPESSDENTPYRRERWYGKFQRSFLLPTLVETDRIKATYRDGVLTVSLPKAEEIRPREIKIETL